MRILLVNWQDRENPQAGGAEIHLHEIFGRLAAKGHEVRLLCGGWPGCPPRARLDGIDVLSRRHAAHVSVSRAPATIDEHLDGWADVLVEDINKVPLYTPRWGAKRRVALVPHLFGVDGVPGACRAARRGGLARRAAAGPRVSQRAVSRRSARAPRTISRIAAFRASRSTVIYPGIDTVAYTPERRRALADAGLRLPRAAQEVQGRASRRFAPSRRWACPTRVLEIAGAGDYRPELEALAHSLDLGDRVRFLGRISEAEKLALLRRSWALVFASPKEGGASRTSKRPRARRRSSRPTRRAFASRCATARPAFSCRTATCGAMAARDAPPRRVARARRRRSGVPARAFAETFTWERAADETERIWHRAISRTHGRHDCQS